MISNQIRLRHPDFLHVGDFSIVDDFCYLSTRVEIGFCSHLASSCTVAGGKAYLFKLGDFSSISAGSRIWCSSNDYAEDLVVCLPVKLPDFELKESTGDVIFESYTGLGANSVVMPNNRIPEGSVIGALSFVPEAFDFEPWTVYAGCPIRPLRKRNREVILKRAECLRKKLEEIR